MNLIKVIQLAALLLTLPGCTQPRPEGPPEIRYGQAECAHCGMIVTDDRYASAIRATIENEHRDFFYDDLKCMYLNDRREKLPAEARRYVHDAETRAWLSIDQARFILDPEVQTPMGSGILAFATSSPRAAGGVTYDKIDTLTKRPASSTTDDPDASTTQ